MATSIYERRVLRLLRKEQRLAYLKGELLRSAPPVATERTPRSVPRPPHDPLWALRYLLLERWTDFKFWLCPSCGARHYATRTARHTIACCWAWALRWGKEVPERRPSGTILIRRRGKYLQVVFGEHGSWSGWSWRPPRPGVGAVLAPDRCEVHAVRSPKPSKRRQKEAERLLAEAHPRASRTYNHRRKS